jgi:hypothetical protein
MEKIVRIHSNFLSERVNLGRIETLRGSNCENPLTDQPELRSKVEMERDIKQERRLTTLTVCVRCIFPKEVI